MDFTVKAILQEHVESTKHPGSFYDRVLVDFGKFQKIVLLNNLELEVLKSSLKPNA